MQTLLTGPPLMIIVTTAVIVLFAFGFVFVIIASNRRIIQEQQQRLDELQRSEQRYKTLFDTSLAGMFTFSVSPFIVFETNRTILEMFNVANAYELQRTLSDLPNGQTKGLETAVRAAGVVEAFEISFTGANGIKRRFLLSARKEENENIIHAVVVLMTAERLIG